MLPTIAVDEERLPSGGALSLRRRGEEWLILTGGVVLMSSRQHGSEERLAAEALARVPQASRILVGGLGLGFTLRAALDAASPGATLHVVELMPALVRWSQQHLGYLAGHPLDDPRVSVEVGDVGEVIARATASWDVILLDVDNGPEALTVPSNAALYGAAGVARSCQALRTGGCLALWSRGPSPAFLTRLARAGLQPEAMTVRAHAASGERHTLYFGRR